jgi:hypothetical protein
MTCAAVTFPDITAFDGRVFALRDYRRVIVGGVCIGLGTVAASCVMAGFVALAAAWIVATPVSTHPPIHAGASLGSGMLALNLVPITSDRFVMREPGPSNQLETETTSAATVSSAPASTAPVPLTPMPEEADSVETAPEVAAAPPPPPTPAARKPLAPAKAPRNSISLPGSTSRDAVYDIAAHTVYLPSGEKLEAHSGLGKRRDDPRYVGEKNRGPTPPNVYHLALRGQLFHGVRAIRLNPVGDAKMFGRDGILAHTYMLGPTGQSFGCVSFKNYPAFLRAYLNGEVDRLVVVPRLEAAGSPALSGRRQASRHAFDDI